MSNFHKMILNNKEDHDATLERVKGYKNFTGLVPINDQEVLYFQNCKPTEYGIKVCRNVHNQTKKKADMTARLREKLLFKKMALLLTDDAQKNIQDK